MEIALSSALHLCLTFLLAKILKNLQQRLRIIAAKEVQKTSEVFARFRSFFLSLPCFSRIAERQRIWTGGGGLAVASWRIFVFVYCAASRSCFYGARTEIRAKIKDICRKEKYFLLCNKINNRFRVELSAVFLLTFSFLTQPR